MRRNLTFIHMCLCSSMLCTVLSANVHAQESLDIDSLLVEPYYEFDLRAQSLAPIRRDGLCPDNTACMFEGGGGVGASIGRRWPSGFSLGFAYDLVFFDSNSVYEQGWINQFMAFVRYYPWDDYSIYPTIELGGGGVVLGDLPGVDTIGWVAQASLGVRWEASERWSFTVNTPVRILQAREFTTDIDQVQRGGDDVLIAWGLSFGMVILYH